MKNLSLFLLFGIFICCTVELFADTLYLHGGEVTEGKIVQETADTYILQQGNIWKRINKTDVAYSNNNSGNDYNIQKVDLDLIIKFGRDLSAKSKITNSDSFSGSYDISEKYCAGFEFDIRAFSNVYFGAGFSVSNEGCISSNNSFRYMDIPYYLLAKIKHNVGSNINLYTSVNFGMHSLITGGRISDSVYVGDDVVSKNSVYYGLNVGLELKDLLIELGFVSYEAEIRNDGGWSVSAYKYRLINQSVILSVGYKIL